MLSKLRLSIFRRVWFYRLIQTIFFLIISNWVIIISVKSFWLSSFRFHIWSYIVLFISIYILYFSTFKFVLDVIFNLSDLIMTDITITYLFSYFFSWLFWMITLNIWSKHLFNICMFIHKTKNILLMNI